MKTMMTGGACAALTLFAASASAQQFSHDVPLSGLGNGNPAKPFGIAYEPASDRIFVAIAGSFGGPNDVVAVIDPATDQVVGTIQTELYPEEIAFAYDSAGALLYGAVSNASSGSLTLFDAGLQVLGHVALPDPFGLGSCYPFGVVWHPGSARFYVSTMDGSGDLHAVDPVTLAVDAGASRTLGSASGSRLAIHGDTLYCAATRYNAGFTNAETSLAALELNGGLVDETLLVPESRGSYPALQDLQRLADGRLVAGGIGFGGLLYVLDADGSLQRSFHLPSAGGAHGLAVDPSGELLAVCDLGGDRLVLWDLLNNRELSSVALNTVGLGYGQPNDAVFAHGKLYLSSQATEELVVFDQLPDPTPSRSYSGLLSVSDTTPLPGQTLSATVYGQGVIGLAVSREGEASGFAGLDAEIGPSARVLTTGAVSVTHAVVLPNQPSLRGMHLWLQGAVDLAGNAQTTEPRLVVVQ